MVKVVRKGRRRILTPAATRPFFQGMMQLHHGAAFFLFLVLFVVHLRSNATRYA
jgi:hypothetical protein